MLEAMVMKTEIGAGRLSLKITRVAAVWVTARSFLWRTSCKAAGPRRDFFRSGRNITTFNGDYQTNFTYVNLRTRNSGAFSYRIASEAR